MAVRSATEIISSIKEMGLGGEGLENLLEDITDSVNPAESESFKELQSKLEKANRDYQDMRDRYINRFYNGYDKPNDTGYILGQAEQGVIEKTEERDYYNELFE